MSVNTFHVAMYPWFALGHLTSYLHISNKLAERGHMISFLMPRNTIPKLEHFNLHPGLISFIPISVPRIEGLPPNSETTADLPFSLHSLLMTAMDLTEPVIEVSLRELKPHMVFYDFTHWLPALACRLGIKALHYCTISPATVGYLISPERKLHEKPLTEADLINPPPSFPPSAIRLQPHEARGLTTITTNDYGKGISFMERQLISLASSDAVIFKTCREMEGPYCDYLENQMRKQVLLAGPGRGVVHGDWVQQQLILSHPSVGCFVTHCGSGSLTEAMVNECQLVLLPHAGDQFINARIMSGDLKVGVEVKKSEEDGVFTKEAVCKAVKAVMDNDSEVGHVVRENHVKWREFLLSKRLENSYVDDLVQKLHSMLKS
uniref:PREDICTED: anthocyanidin 3-O-glucosyltransferase n=1 Tax=Lupinus angustifolius TaxID=3871 RepID=A0A2K4N7T2_LUPAN|nr:PREDICTED: anthocyanidin 3-O-glucosyltransferase [Lupinus angustifolius]